MTHVHWELMPDHLPEAEPGAMVDNACLRAMGHPTDQLLSGMGLRLNLVEFLPVWGVNSDAAACSGHKWGLVCSRRDTSAVMFKLLDAGTTTGLDARDVLDFHLLGHSFEDLFGHDLLHTMFRFRSELLEEYVEEVEDLSFDIDGFLAQIGDGGTTC